MLGMLLDSDPRISRHCQYSIQDGHVAFHSLVTRLGVSLNVGRVNCRVIARVQFTTGSPQGGLWATHGVRTPQHAVPPPVKDQA